MYRDDVKSLGLVTFYECHGAITPATRGGSLIQMAVGESCALVTADADKGTPRTGLRNPMRCVFPLKEKVMIASDVVRNEAHSLIRAPVLRAPERCRGLRGGRPERCGDLVRSLGFANTLSVGGAWRSANALCTRSASDRQNAGGSLDGDQCRCSQSGQNFRLRR